MSGEILICLIAVVCFNCFVLADWITIDESTVTTWNENNADRSTILAEFSVSNYPRQYTNGLEISLDTFTTDIDGNAVYFVMQQDLYEVSKFFRYNWLNNKIEQTEFVENLLVDYIQYNQISKKLYAITRNNTGGRSLVLIDRQRLSVQTQVMSLDEFPSPMPGSYFQHDKQYFTYHAYDFQRRSTVLITLDLSDGSTQRFVHSTTFDFNVAALVSLQSTGHFYALWQYSIITPLLVIEFDQRTATALSNVSITPDRARVAQGYNPTCIDTVNELFYVVSSNARTQQTWICRVHLPTMQINVTTVAQQTLNEYLIIKI
jgi:hypothetical protein